MLEKVLLKCVCPHGKKVETVTWNKILVRIIGILMSIQFKLFDLILP